MKQKMQNKLKPLVTNEDIWQKWHWKSDTRYYKVLLHQDLFGNWVLSKEWGGLNNHINGGKSELTDIAQADKTIQAIDKKRKTRGYSLIRSYSN
jgi:hypothetical protein